MIAIKQLAQQLCLDMTYVAGINTIYVLKGTLTDPYIEKVQDVESADALSDALEELEFNSDTSLGIVMAFYAMKYKEAEEIDYSAKMAFLQSKVRKQLEENLKSEMESMEDIPQTEDAIFTFLWEQLPKYYPPFQNTPDAYISKICSVNLYMKNGTLYANIYDIETKKHTWLNVYKDKVGVTASSLNENEVFTAMEKE